MSSIIVGRPSQLASTSTFSTLSANGATTSAILMGTTDAADNGKLTIGVASNAAAGRGSHIQLHGNENAEAGSLYLRSGNASGGVIGFYTSDLLRWQISNTGGDFAQNGTNGADIVFNKTSSANVIRMGTSDASDSGRIVVAGGGASNTSGTRGSEIHFLGNEVGGGVGGSLQMYAGNLSSGFISKDINNTSGYELTRISGTDKFRVANTLITAGCVINHTATMGNSTKNPTSDAPADWVECQIGGTTYYLPAYAA